MNWRTATLALMAGILSSNPTLAGTTEVIDGDTIRIDGTTYRLHGIDAPEAGQKCKGTGKRDWPCGKRATERLQALVDGRDVECDHREMDDYDRVIAVCRADDVEINRAMVQEGYAWAFVRYSTDYADIEQEARTAGVGVWRAPTETPWDYRAKRWEEAGQEAPDPNCPIKGNISANGRIYHAPWSPWYTRTKINTAKGEMWFCSEREALDAGWRAPIWGR